MNAKKMGYVLLTLCLVTACQKDKPAQDKGPKPTSQNSAKDKLKRQFSALKKLADIPVRTGKISGAFAVAPDEKSFVVGGTDGSVMLVPFASGKHRVFIGHTEPVYEATFIPDGQKLLTGGADNRLRIWDMRTGKSLFDINAHNGDLKALAVSTDGTLAVSGSVADDVRVWRIADGKRTQHFSGHTQSVYDVIFAPNGQHIYSAARDASVRRWSLATGRSKGTPINLPNTNVALDWSPDGKVLYATGLHRQLVWLDPADWKIMHRKRVAKSRVLAMDVSPQGHIALGEHSGRVSVWSPNPKTEEPLLEIPKAHNGQIKGIEYLSDGAVLTTLGDDGKVLRWNALTGTIIGEPPQIPPINGVVQAVAAHPTSPHVAIASNGKLFVVNASNAKEITPAQPNLGPGGIASLAYSPTGDQLIVGRDTGVIRVSKTDNSATEVATHSIHGGAVRHMQFENGDTLWTAGDDLAIHQLDAKTFKIKKTISDHTSRVVSLAVDPKGKRIATTEEDNITFIRYVKSNTIQWTLRGHNVTHMEFSPDGNTLATVQKRRVIVLYEVEIQKKAKELRGNTNRITGMKFHPNGEVLFVIDSLGTLRAWSVADGSMLASENAGRGKPRALAVGDNGNLIVTGGMDPEGSAKLFSLSGK